MARKEIGTKWDRVNRNNMNDNFKELYNKNNSTQKQIDELILNDGESDLEVVQARIDSEGNSYRTLKERLDTEHDELNTKIDSNHDELNTKIDSNHDDVTSQLAQKANEKEIQQHLNNKRDKSTSINLNDVDSEFLAAIEGGSETSFNLESIPRKHSVSPETTTFIQLPTNMFNHDDVLGGHALDTNGDVYENSQYDVTNFIEVQPESDYTLLGFLRIAHYTEDKTLSYIQNLIHDEVTTVTTPLNTKYIRVHYKNDPVDSGYVEQKQINEGSSLLPYEKFSYKLQEKIQITSDSLLGSIGVEKVGFIEKTSNLFNPLTVTKNHAIDLATGELFEHEDYNTTDFIKVEPNTEYTMKGFRRVVYFNKNKERIPGGTNVSNEDVHSDFTITTTPRCEYIKVMYINHVGHDSFVEQKQINEGTSLLPYEKYNYKFTDNLNIGKEEEKREEYFIFDTSLEGTFSIDKTFDDYTETWGDILSDDVYAMFDSLQSSYSEYITKQPLANDPTGLAISAYHLKPNRPVSYKAKRFPKIYITTGTHGYEHATTLNMYLLIKQMCESWTRDPLLEFLRFNVELIIIPIVNPYGWNNYIRKNSNGVDINRNFPDNWVSGSPNDSTYGGSAPLTEVESLNIKQIFDEHPDIDIYYDYHNFTQNPDNHFIWLATASPRSSEICEPMIRKLSRKWQKDFSFIPDGKFIGYTSHMTVGTIHNYAKRSLGIELSGTFETCDNWLLDPNGVLFDQNTLKAGVEAIANFLIMNLRSLAK